MIREMIWERQVVCKTAGQCVGWEAHGRMRRQGVGSSAVMCWGSTCGRLTDSAYLTDPRKEKKSIFFFTCCHRKRWQIGSTTLIFSPHIQLISFKFISIHQFTLLTYWPPGHPMWNVMSSPTSRLLKTWHTMQRVISQCDFCEILWGQIALKF